MLTHALCPVFVFNWLVNTLYIHTYTQQLKNNLQQKKIVLQFVDFFLSENIAEILDKDTRTLKYPQVSNYKLIKLISKYATIVLCVLLYDV